MSITVKKIILGEIETNTYIITDDISGETAVVDPAIPDGHLLQALSGKNVVYILLTHGHYDHIMGVKAVKEQTGAKAVIHREDALCLEGDAANLFSNHHPGESQPVTKADIAVEDGDILPFGGGNIKVMHTPGHTRGGCCYIFEDDRLIFSGDTLFRLSVGRTDFPGGNAREELCSLSKLASLSGDYRVFPGHEEETTLEFERCNNRYMRRKHAPVGK